MSKALEDGVERVLRDREEQQAREILGAVKSIAKSLEVLAAYVDMRASGEFGRNWKDLHAKGKF